MSIDASPTDSLEDFWSRLKATAEAAWEHAEASGLQLIQELVPVVENGLSKALDDFGALASSTILHFMQAEYEHLTGAEKHGQVVTEIFQSAEAQGKELALEDANALVKNLFLTLTGTAPG